MKYYFVHDIQQETETRTSEAQKNNIKDALHTYHIFYIPKENYNSFLDVCIIGDPVLVGKACKVK